MKKIVLVAFMALTAVSFGDIIDDCEKGCERYMETDCLIKADKDGRTIRECKEPNIKAHLDCQEKCDKKKIRF